jgi:hypothetical protein
MNIFVLDKNPIKSAEYLCDRHVIKMCLESAQLLCGARILFGNKAPYKLTHKNHPVLKWLCSHSAHYHWTYLLGKAICREYTYRYGKQHASEKVIDECGKEFFAGHIPYFFPASYSTVYNLYDSMKKPALAMPTEYKKDDAILSYRLYYALDKFFNIEFRYKKRQQPKWISEIHSENKEAIQRYTKNSP